MYLLCVLVVESTTTAAPRGHRARVNGRDHRRRPVLARIAQWQPDQGAAAAARAVSALALSALAVIHVVDLPGTLGPTPLVGYGYLGIIAAAILIGGVLIARPHWLAWAAAGAVAGSAMGGYILTRGLPGGLPGDSGGWGNWQLPAGRRRAQRGVGDHPARPARRPRRLSGADPRRKRGGTAPDRRAACA